MVFAPRFALREPGEAAARRGRRVRLLALALALALPACDSLRLYAKHLMDPRESAAVTVPVKVSIGIFVFPAVIAWLPVSGPLLLLLHDETAVWFALAPGLILGGPFVLLAGAPGYLLTDRPGERPESEDVASPDSSATTAPVPSGSR
ncbi:hypothetical protein HY251_00075 [bacterium]|nr:hypothetical protein [bacterium]